MISKNDKEEIESYIKEMSPERLRAVLLNIYEQSIYNEILNFRYKDDCTPEYPDEPTWNPGFYCPHSGVSLEELEN